MRANCKSDEATTKNKRSVFGSRLVNVRVLVYLLLYCSLLNAQKSQFHFEHLNGQGIPQSAVLSICRDSLGLMWFGTYTGLYRFDGYSVKHYTYNPSIPNSICHNTVEDIIVDRHGVLWFATADGLCSFDYKDELFHAYKKNDPVDSLSIGFNDIRSLYMETYRDTEDILWIGTHGGGLDRFDCKRKVFRHFTYDISKSSPKSSSISHNNISQIYKDRHNNLWIATDGGLDLVVVDSVDLSITFKHFRHDSTKEKSISFDNVISICEDKKGNLWVGTWDYGINRLNDGYNIRLIYNQDLEFDRFSDQNCNIITDILENDSGVLFATLDGGIKSYKSAQNTFIRSTNDPFKPNTISNDIVLDLFEDPSGILWVGTYQGIDIFDPFKKKFELYKTTSPDSNTLIFTGINSLLVDSNSLGDTVWIGSQSKGLSRWIPQKDSVKRYKKNNKDTRISDTMLLNNDVRTMCRDKLNGLWIGTLGGLSRLENGRFFHYTPNSSNDSSLSSKDIYSLFEDSRKILWIGTYRGGLNCLDLKVDKNRVPQNSSFKSFVSKADDPTSISDMTIWVIFEDSDHCLWVGTERGGLNRYNRDKNNFTRCTFDPDSSTTLSNNFVRCIIEGDDGALWIGTASGLNKLDKIKKHAPKPEFIRYTMKQGNNGYGLPSNSINALLQDKSHIIWISTDRGISRFDPKTGEFRNYNSEDGLQSEEFNIKVSGIGARGILYFGGNKGLNIFDPDKIIDNKFIPSVIITDFKMANESVPVGKMKDERTILSQSIVKTRKIELSDKDDVISFEFAALHYGSPEFHQFAYYMDGVDKDTIYCGNRWYANYTNIPWGDHDFFVKASNSDGIWDKGTHIKIVIKRPYWAHWWFIGPATLLFLVAVVLVFKSRISSIKKNEERLRKLVDERTKQLASLNSAENELTRVIRDGKDAVFSTLCEQAKKMVTNGHLCVAFYEEKKKNLVFRLIAENQELVTADENMCISYDPDLRKNDMVATVISKGEPIRLLKKKDINTWGGESGCKDIPGAHACSWMGIPMIAWKKVLGIIVVYDSEKEDAYSEQDEQILSTLAHQAAVTLDNANLLDKIQQISKTYPSISDLSKDQDAVLKQIVEIASDVLESDVTVLYRYDQRNNRCITPPITSGHLLFPNFMNTDVAHNDAPYRIIRHDENIYAKDSKNHEVLHSTNLPPPREGIPSRFLFREKIESSAALLLKVFDEIVGVMFINYRSPHEFDENEKKIIELCSSYVAIAVQTVFHFHEKERDDVAVTLETTTGRFAHLLKNKFGSIQLLLESVLYNVDPNKVTTRLSAALKILDQSTGIIKKLLALSKLKVHNKEDVNIGSILNEMTHELQSQLDICNIEFITEYKGDLHVIHADPTQIKLVFLNLADNSIAFMKNGGKITVSVYTENDSLYVDWLDTGTGIPLEHYDRIFNIGFTTRNEGFGLGLYHTRAIIEEYGGNISIDQNYLHGTKFIIQLPI